MPHVSAALRRQGLHISPNAQATHSMRDVIYNLAQPQLHANKLGLTGHFTGLNYMHCIIWSRPLGASSGPQGSSIWP